MEKILKACESNKIKIILTTSHSINKPLKVWHDLTKRYFNIDSR